MGKAMGIAVKAVDGRADGNRVKAAVASILAVCALVAIVAFHPSAALAASFEPVAGSGTGAFLIPSLRLARVLLLVLGIVGINYMLICAFTFMVASGRNETQKAGNSKMSAGFFVTMLVAALFLALTVSLKDLGY